MFSRFRKESSCTNCGKIVSDPRHNLVGYTDGELCVPCDKKLNPNLWNEEKASQPPPSQPPSPPQRKRERDERERERDERERERDERDERERERERKRERKRQRREKRERRERREKIEHLKRERSKPFVPVIINKTKMITAFENSKKMCSTNVLENGKTITTGNDLFQWFQFPNDWSQHKRNKVEIFIRSTDILIGYSPELKLSLTAEQTKKIYERLLFSDNGFTGYISFGEFGLYFYAPKQFQFIYNASPGKKTEIIDAYFGQ